MAMNGDQLGQEILAAAIATLPLAAESPVLSDEAAKAIGNAIVSHIITNGVVIVSGGSSSGNHVIT